MGIDQSIDKSQQLLQLKRQNHPILGQLTLLQHPITKKIFNLKHTKQQSQHIPKSLQIGNNQDNNNSNNDKPYIQIQRIGNNSPVLMSCASQQSCTIIIDSVEVDLQTIQNSTLFKGFNQADLLNIMENVLDAIVVLNSRKIGIFPVCEKSVVVSGQEEYQGEDLSKVVFKVIPNQLVKYQNMKQFHKIIIVPPEIQQSFSFPKQQAYLSYSPKNQIYCLGVLILNLIAGHVHPQKTLDISFGNESASILNFQVGTKDNDVSDFKVRGQLLQKWIVLQENPNFSVQFKKIINLMIKQVQQDRIGLTCLNDRVKRIKNKTICNKNNERLSIKPVLCSKENSCYKEQRKSKRTMSVIEISNKNKGLYHQSKLEEKINAQLAISPCLPSSLTPTNNNFRSQDYIRSARQKKLFVLECQLNNEKNTGQSQPHRTIKFKNGAYYEGQLDEFNNFNGFGTLFYNLKQICYTGYWKNNQFNGFGYLFNQARKDFNHEAEIDYHDFGNDQYEKLWQHYEGQFRDDFRHGYGVLYFMNGTKIEGQFANGKVQGSGSFVKRNGQTINGFWHENKLIKQYE